MRSLLAWLFGFKSPSVGTYETVMNKRNGTMRRAVGYCENIGSREHGGCEDFGKGVFLLNHGDTFYCPRCREIGLVVTEKGKLKANHI